MYKNISHIGLPITSIVIMICTLEFLLRGVGFVYSQQQRQKNPDTARGDVYRILTLGESTTAGGQDSWPHQLERILNKRAKTRKFYVINEGVEGVDTAYIVARLDINIKKYSPHMVITMMGINDKNLHVRYDDTLQTTLLLELYSLRLFKLWRLVLESLTGGQYSWSFRQSPTDTSGDLMHKAEVSKNRAISHLLEKIFFTPDIRAKDVATLYQKEGFGIVAEPALKDSEITAYHYRKLFEKLSRRGISYIAMQYPTLPVEDIEHFFLNVSEKEQITFVDNKENFQNALKQSQYNALFEDSFAGSFGHTTKEGSRLIAQQVAEKILSLLGE